MNDGMQSRFVDEKKLRRQSRRDFILFGAGLMLRRLLGR